MARWYKKKRFWFLLLSVLLLIYIGTIIYHQVKALPEGVSVATEPRSLSDDDVTFLVDHTYQQGDDEIVEHEIFDELYAAIENAEEFLIIDMFMVNETSNESRMYPPLSSEFSERIATQMERHPDLNVVFITDHLNTTYGSHEAEHIDYLADLGAEIIYTDLSQLRDPNPLYSGLWRMGLQWFGQRGTGWITNPLGETSPEVTVRSLLKLTNIKANHRKVLITEDAGYVLSANPHDASGFNSNIGIKVQGEFLYDLIESEKAVAAFSGGDVSMFPSEESLASLLAPTDGPLSAQVVTEREIEYAVIDALDAATPEDTVWLGMFYLSDRHIIEAMERAADRGVPQRIILDPNQNAFGQEKIGLPNIPVAEELVTLDSDSIDIRWYNTNLEQYHSKIFFVDRPDSAQVIAGSTNFTARNLDDYNLESNLSIEGPPDSAFLSDVRNYFERLWENEDGEFTVEYEEYEEPLGWVKYVTYRIQKALRFTTY
ncbi:hypothetical protein FLK61_40830 [Paenalkalicoccus suaedae]|uniref:phospholipase D n=1 Tax=Paenalkalicoccus suaedae TaxID=2592382 RepID=A0A859FJH5_9BACI|nr:phospholipase D family protein [Paenalkalicoccus suaedae]QKS72946.1 hypothetical protein FLK61_40830 [Paenalkalicoccus suaedae]